MKNRNRQLDLLGLFFLYNYHEPNAAMLAPHRSGPVSDDLSLPHGWEGLSMLRPPLTALAIVGVA